MAPTFTLDKVVMQTLGTVANQSELVLVEQMLSVFQQAPSDSNAAQIWGNQTNNGGKGNFQVGACSESNGNVTLTLGAYYFDAPNVNERFLWNSYQATIIKLYQSVQRAVLNEDIYKQVRRPVLDKLGDRVQQFVAAIDL